MYRSVQLATVIGLFSSHARPDPLKFLESYRYAKIPIGAIFVGTDPRYEILADPIACLRLTTRGLVDGNGYSHQYHIVLPFDLSIT
jgi:hypothetical protein